jgi:hypothetical protein
MPERCSGARVRFAAQNPRALAPSAPFRLGRNRDGRLRREHDEYDQFAGIIYLRKGTSVSPLDKLIMEVPEKSGKFHKLDLTLRPSGNIRNRTAGNQQSIVINGQR